MRDARRAKGLTQIELGEAVGMPQTRISALELGKYPNPTIRTVRALERVLGVELIFEAEEVRVL